MARFDPKTGEIVVRIVYDGLGTAGKTSNLKVLHEAFAKRASDSLIMPEQTETGRTLFFDWLELSVGHLDDWPLRAQVIAVPGQFVYAARRFRLLQEIDGVVLVCESTEHGIRAGRIALAFLQKALVASRSPDVPVVLQANKQDLDNAFAPEEVARSLAFNPSAVVGSDAHRGDGVRLTLIKALDLVRARVRRVLDGRSPKALPTQTETAAELYQSLVTEDGETPTADLAEALESALAEVK